MISIQGFVALTRNILQIIQKNGPTINANDGGTVVSNTSFEWAGLRQKRMKAGNKRHTTSSWSFGKDMV
jgi:RecJ-like exonuclease